ncbi:HMA2 domain-containing protein [uncultured Clostridium sp.]|uniref:HMA2 domain-containing protein n=1 Tax=uncultured Clostridium sp. TaxID=59620 RepID=UPI002618916F|nr:hypothetical protein [uncultured Clostridium sp.]
MFKKMFITQMLKIKIEKRFKGRIIFKINSLKKMEDEYVAYEKFLYQALRKLEGIESIDIDTKEGSVDIKYNEKVLKEELLLKWVEILKEVGINNYDFIEEMWEKNEKLVVDKIDKELDEKMKGIRRKK